MGDDAAALRPPARRVAILTTDALVEGIHFVRDSPPEAIGRAAAGVSLSDAASKGATPAGLLLDILVPPGTPESWLRSVVLGSERAARGFGAHVVGGDTKPSATRTVVSTLVAWGDPRHLAPRTGARPGDRLVVTGRVGRGGLAWRRYRSRPNGSRRTAVLRQMLEVHPRVREGRYLSRFAHAMLDTSDGLADAARLMSEASRVRLLIEEERIPWARGLTDRSGSSARRIDGFFGGDYELLAAVPRRWLSRALRTPGVGVAVIGRVVRGHDAWLVRPDGTRPMPPAGWQPFGRTPLNLDGSHRRA